MNSLFIEKVQEPTIALDEFRDADDPLKGQLDTNDVFCQSQKKYKNQPILDGWYLMRFLSEYTL